MTHRRNGRGTYVIDRCFDGIGRIRRASGTSDAGTFRAIDGLLTALYEQGRPDLLEEIRDGRVKPVVALGWFRLGKLDRIPSAETLRPLAERWTAWAAGLEASPSHKRDLLTTLRALGAGGHSVADAPALTAALIRAKADKARMIQKAKAHVQGFLRDELGIDHPLYRQVRKLKVGRVEVARKATPYSLEEIRALMGRMPEGAAEVWTLCATGMGPKEYWGVWRLLPDRVEIDGTKRKGRKRIVPRWTALTRPTMGARKLARLVARASGGAVRLYDFRATFARWLMEAEIPRLNRSLYMGHGAKSMTEHYEWGELPGQLVADARKLEVRYGAPGLRLHQAGGVA